MVKKRQMIEPVELIVKSNPFSTMAEQYRKIRTNIEFSSADKKIKSLVVSSSELSEGKSLTAANLAIVFANAGSKVLLIDADLRRPSVALSFKIANDNGLSTYLTSNNVDSNSSCYNRNQQNEDTKLMIQPIKSQVKNLYLLPSGPIPPNPSELLGSKRMQKLIDSSSEVFDMVILDTPPVVTVTDAQIISAVADGTILVVREGVTKKQKVLEAKRLLDMVKANIIGVVYNGKKSSEDNYYYMDF